MSAAGEHGLALLDVKAFLASGSCIGDHESTVGRGHGYLIVSIGTAIARCYRVGETCYGIG